MLRMIAWLSLFVFVAALVALGGMPALGRRLPDRAPWVRAGFDACALPCWGGITAGTTPFSDVVAHLNQTLTPEVSRLLVSGSQVVFWTEDGGQAITGVLHYTAGTVGTLNVQVAQPAGQLVRRLGTPDCVWIESSSQDLLMLYWDDSTISVGALFTLPASRRWSPDTPTEQIWVSTVQFGCRGDRALDWLGFAPYARYQTALMRLMLPPLMQ